MQYSLYVTSLLTFATWVPSLDAQETISLQRWQSCAGCRAAVESFSSRAFPAINKALEVEGKTESMDLEHFTEGMCQTPQFQHYKEFVEHGESV